MARTRTGSINDDLIIEILVRVPNLEILHRCKVVCTTWKRLISHPSLVNRFIKRSTSLPPRLTGVYFAENTSRSESPGMKFLDFGNQTVKNTTCFSFLLQSVLVVASHKGYVLCVKKPMQGNVHCNACFPYTLWNHITKECLELPRQRVHHYINFVLLFCYQKEESGCSQIEFKVVCFHHRSSSGLRIGVNIYSSEQGKWKNTTWVSGNDSTLSSLKKTSHNQFVYYMKNNENLAVYDLMKESVNFFGLPNKRWTILLNCKNLEVSAGSLYFSVVRDETCLSVRELVDGVYLDLKHQIDFRGFVTELPQILDCKTISALAFHPLDSHLVLMSFAAGRNHILVLYNMGTGCD